MRKPVLAAVFSMMLAAPMLPGRAAADEVTVYRTRHDYRHTVTVLPTRFAATVVTMPVESDRMVWQDQEALRRSEGWTDCTLNANSAGDAMYLQTRGNVQIDVAEIVFSDGQSQVVDFGQHHYGSGVYSLMNFGETRQVDHVRVVARSRSDESELVLRMTT